MPPRMLELGTLFKGTLDPSFLASVEKIKSLLKELSGTMETAGRGARSYRDAMASTGSELSQYQLLMGRATNESTKFQAALSQIAGSTQRTGIAMQKAWNTIANVERNLASLGMQMEAQGHKGETFARKMDLTSVAQDMLANKLTISKGRFVQLADGISSASQAAVNASARYNPLVASIEKASKAVSDHTTAMRSGGSELSQYQMYMGRASQESAKFQQAFSQIASGTEKTKIALDQAWNAVARGEKALSNLGLKMNAQNANGEAFARKLDLISIANDMLSNKLTVSKGRFVQLADGISTASRAAVNASNRYDPLITSTRLMNEEVQIAATGWQKFTGTFKNAIGTMLAWGPAAMAVYGGIELMKSGFQEIIAFDQGLANLRAISNDTDASVARMGETIINVADKTRYSATEIAGAMTQIAQAGFSAGESIEVVQAAALLATGTLEKITTTADLLTSTIRSFNLDAIEAGRVADVFAAALNYTKLTVDGLRVTMNYLGPAAYASGLSLEEAAAAAGILADSGMRASTVGTNLRQMLARLIAPTKAIRQAFAENNIELEKINPLTNDFATVIDNLAKVIPNSQRAFELFGLRAANAVMVLTRVGAEGFKVMLDNLMTVGNASTMAAKQMEGLGSMLENLYAKAKNLVITIGEGGLATAIRAVIDVGRILIDVLTVLAGSSIGQFLIAAGLMSAAVYAVIAAFKLLNVTSVVSSIMSAVTAFATATAAAYATSGALGVLTAAWNALKLAFATHPIGMVAIALGTVIVALQSLWQWQAKETLEAEKNAQQYMRNIEVLEKYKEKLDSVNEGSLEQASILARLANDFPELTTKIEEAGNSIERQKQLIDELLVSQKELAIQNLEGAIRGHTKSFEDLNEKVKWSKDNLDAYANDSAWGQLGTVMKDILWGDDSKAIEHSKVLWYELKSAMGGAVPVMTNLGKNYSDLSAQQKKTRMTLAELAAQYESITGKKWDFGNLNIPVTVAKSMYDFKKAIRAVEEGLENLDDEARKTMQRDILTQFGGDWIRLYDKLDERGKAHLMTYAIQTKAKQSQIDKQVQEGVLTTQQGELKKQDIADQSYKQMLQKEKAKNDQMLGEYQKYLQDYLKHANEHQKALDTIYKAEAAKLKQNFDERLRGIDNVYQEELTKLQLSKQNEGTILKEKNRLHDKYYQDVLSLTREYMQQQLTLADQDANTKKQSLERQYQDVVTGLQREAQEHTKLKDTLTRIEREKEDAIIAIDRETINHKRTILNEILSATRSHIGQLKQEYQSLAAEIRGIDEKLLGYKNELVQGERKIRQSAMSEDKKYADNMKEYQRIIAEAEKARYNKSFDEAEKYYKEAAQLAEGMTGEIKDESGKVVVTAQQNADTLTKMFQTAMEGYKKTLEQHREADKARMDDLMKLMNDLIKLEDDIKNKIMAIGTEEMRINTAAAESALKELSISLNEIKRQIDELDGSTITIYKEIVEVGGGGSGSDESGGTYEGYSEGGKLPGYGGGDIVPARLEPGEFVVRKEAVKRYGAGFLAALNNMRLTLPETFKRYLKGTFGTKPTYAMGYAQGGLVGRSETLTLRLQAGEVELPVTVAGKNPKQMVKDFAKELSKMRLTRVR